MSGVLDRLAAFFVAPAAEPATGVALPDVAPTACPVTPSAAPVRSAVVVGGREALASARALAAALRRDAGAPAGLVLAWGAGTVRRLPAAPAAARLAARLVARGHEAVASGRLVIVTLADPDGPPDDDREAAAEAGRATAAAGDIPAVLALARPRGPAFAERLGEHDLVVMTHRPDADPALAQLAADALADAHPRLSVEVMAAAPPGPVPRPCRLPPGATGRRGERGQASLLLVGALLAVVLGAVVLGGVARGFGAQGEQQRAADLAALAGARAMRDAYPRLYEPGDRHLEAAGYVALGRRVAEETARRNGAREVDVRFPPVPGALAPTRVEVVVRDPIEAGGREVPAGARARAELAVDAGVPAVTAGGGGYDGPLAMRQGKPMRPDVAMAFDRMAAAAQADGVALVVTDGYRSDAEQAQLFARHPDPKWVAPPGRSLHRLGTELDLGPAAAYGWLAANARRFHFVQRYSWEPWHYGFLLNAGTASVGQLSGRYDPERHTSLPSFVPERFAPMLARAAQRWNVSATLLAAQIQQESGFNPFARSPAGAQGIAQFMPGTARLYGLRNPYDAGQALDAQGHLMRDLLRDFGSVGLALAAYNAGPAPVRSCGCVPAIPETQAYVAAILGLLHGAGDTDALGAGLEVRLVA